MLDKAYDHTKVESKIYQQWLDSGFFNPDNLKGEPYTIILPPPNVTGTLHLGHALTATIEDILMRFKRMQGYKTLWLPGTDHAAIATQSKVEKLLEKEGVKKKDLGREEFLKRVEKFAQDSHDTIISQLKSMGASLDWSREAFTLDEKRNFAVRTAFKQLYDLGLIYRAHRVINWDVKGQTTISDDEVVYVERAAKLYTFRYSKDFPIAISSTRPETKPGDTAVAVHPDDERYAKYIGKEYDLEFAGVPIHIKVIADHAVEKDFGTGALGVTPAHSILDSEMAQRHDLPYKQLIDERGRMTVGDERLMGKKAEEARAVIVEWLRDNNLLEKEEDIKQNVATAERTGGVIEPLPKLQWFISVEKEFKLPHSEIKGIKSGETVTLKKLMRHAVESGEIKITPEHFSKIYFHWIDNLRDWCISRQIWYGHRIPVWFKTKTGSDMEFVHFEEAVICKKLGLADEKAFDKFSNELLAENDFKNKNIQWGSNRDGVIQLYIGFTNLLKQKDLLDDTWIEQNRIKRLQTKAEMHVGEPPKETFGWYQDEDTLDTWFSAGLWTFTTLGWPEKTLDLKTFHPTDVLETGYDILFFWVARMVLMSTTLTGQIPFKNVFLHGIIRDADKKKMSKSKGNIIDPLDMTAKYRTDALRFALIFNTAPGTDMALAEDKIKGMKHFANKLWNIARFVLSNSDKLQVTSDKPEAKTEADKEILAKLDEVIKSSTKNIENFLLHEAAQEIYQFVWKEFADVYIEESKKQLQDEKLKQNTLSTLHFLLSTSLKLLHPFMPFVTEEIWSKLNQKQLLLVEKWPQTK